jgi:hypothetical protein
MPDQEMCLYSAIEKIVDIIIPRELRQFICFSIGNDEYVYITLTARYASETNK